MTRTNYDPTIAQSLLIEAAGRSDAQSFTDPDGWARVTFKKDDAAVEVFVSPTGETFSQTVR